MRGNVIRREIATDPEAGRTLSKGTRHDTKDIPGDGIRDRLWRNVGAEAAKPSGAPDIDPDSVILHAVNASSNEDFAACVTKLKIAHDSVACSRTGGTISDPHPPLQSNVDRLRTTRPRMPGHQDPPDPARASGTIKKTSVDERARALLDLVAAGNECAYEELYRMLSRRVYAFVRRMIDNAESADEIMVDTMYEVWRTAGRYRGDSQVTTWILGIARNKVLMALRSRNTAPHEDIDDFADIIDSGVPDGYALLAQKQTREMIQRCIQELSEKHRECIHLTHFEDMSMPEIAAVLGIPEGTVKSRLSHARARLAAKLSVMLQRAATP